MFWKSPQILEGFLLPKLGGLQTLHSSSMTNQTFTALYTPETDLRMHLLQKEKGNFCDSTFVYFRGRATYLMSLLISGTSGNSGQPPLLHFALHFQNCLSMLAPLHMSYNVPFCKSM